MNLNPIHYTIHFGNSPAVSGYEIHSTTGDEASKEKEQKRDDIHPVGATYDWRLMNYSERNKYLLRNKLLTDITMEVGPEATAFEAHKLILAMASPVFEAMFFGVLAEKGNKVSIPDIMPDGFKILLEYIYTDNVCLENITQAFQGWVAADKYYVPALKMICNAFFESCPLDSSVVWEVLESAILVDLHHLKKRCLQYISEETTNSFQAAAFLETSAKAVEAVLSLDVLQRSEMFLLQRLVAWGQNQVQTKEEDTTLREVLWPLLKNVRIATLTPIEFCTITEETKGLFQDAEAFAILKHLIDPKFPSPPWLCKKSEKRSNSSNGFYYKPFRKISDDDQKTNKKVRKYHNFAHFASPENL